MVILITELTNVSRPKQLVANCANSSLLLLGLLVLIVVLCLHNLWFVGRIRFLVYGLFNARFCGLLLLTVRWRYLTVILLLLVTFDSAAIVADLLVVRLKLLLHGFLLFLAFRLGGVNFNFYLMLVEIGSIVLDLSLDPALDIFQVIWLHRRCN